MIDVPFIHDFFYEGFPSNKDELLVFIENSKLDPNQKLEWSKDCLVEAKGLELKNNISYFIPLLKDFFASLEIPVYDRNIQMTGLWTNSYTKHCFQEVHDHCPSHLSGVLFLTDEQEGDGKFYFLNKHSSEIPEPFVDMTNNTTNVFARRHFIKAERGKVLLFPSYLMHGVTVHKTDYPRRTASFNFNILQMPSLRYHAGRMVLYEEDENSWRVKIKTKTEKINLPLSSKSLEDAVLEAEYLYADARAISQGKPKCVDCLHWLVVKAECGLGLPEGKGSGGVFAKDCACFWARN